MLIRRPLPKNIRKGSGVQEWGKPSFRICFKNFWIKNLHLTGLEENNCYLENIVLLEVSKNFYRRHFDISLAVSKYKTVGKICVLQKNYQHDLIYIFGCATLPKIVSFLAKIWIKYQKKKSLAQEVRQKSDISDRRRTKGWRKVCLFQSLLCLQYGHWITVRPVWDHVTRKINITFFITN